MPTVLHSNSKARVPWRIVLDGDGSFVIYHFGRVVFCLICHEPSNDRFEDVHRLVRLLYQQKLFKKNVFQSFRDSINAQIIDLSLNQNAV